MAKESSLIHSVSSASLKTLKSFYIVCRHEHWSLFFFIIETVGYPLQHNPTSSITICIYKTVFNSFFAEVVLKSVGFEHTWGFKHMFNHLVELLLESSFYFTELRSTLIEGSFRQGYSSMCFVRPENIDKPQGTSHICVAIMKFW